MLRKAARKKHKKITNYANILRTTPVSDTMSFRYHLERAIYSPRLYQHACAVNAIIGVTAGLATCAYSALHAGDATMNDGMLRTSIGMTVLHHGLQSATEFTAVRDALDGIVAEQAILRLVR